jgi:hypothetical protein
MRWLERSIRWVMLVSGVLTFTMVSAAFAPKAALVSAFGASLDGPVAEIVVRSWGALVALVGLLLVHGAFRPAARPVALVVAAVSKAIFVALVLTFGRHLLAHSVGISIVADSVMVVWFTLYLVAGAHPGTEARVGRGTVPR